MHLPSLFAQHPTPAVSSLLVPSAPSGPLTHSLVLSVHAVLIHPFLHCLALSCTVWSTHPHALVLMPSPSSCLVMAVPSCTIWPTCPCAPVLVLSSHLVLLPPETTTKTQGNKCNDNHNANDNAMQHTHPSSCHPLTWSCGTTVPTPPEATMRTQHDVHNDNANDEMPHHTVHALELSSDELDGECGGGR